MFPAPVVEVLTVFRVMYVFCSFAFGVCFFWCHVVWFDIFFVSTASVDELDILGYAVFFVVSGVRGHR